MNALAVHPPDDSPVFLAALAVHVVAAMAAVAAGAAAGLTRVKGPGRHPRRGTAYVAALCAVVASASVLTAIRPRQDWVVLLIGVAGLALATAGRRVRRRHRPGDTLHIACMGGSYVALFTAFLVDNGRRLPGFWDHLPTLAYWLLPSAIGLPLIHRAARRARERRRSRAGTPARRAVA